MLAFDQKTLHQSFYWNQGRKGHQSIQKHQKRIWEIFGSDKTQIWFSWLLILKAYYDLNRVRQVEYFPRQQSLSRYLWFKADQKAANHGLSDWRFEIMDPLKNRRAPRIRRSSLIVFKTIPWLREKHLQRSHFKRVNIRAYWWTGVDGTIIIDFTGFKNISSEV